MRVSVIPLVLIALLASSFSLSAQTAFPRMTTVDPTTGKAGDILTVSGENLDKGNVAEVFLTDGKNDFKAGITEQSAETLKVKVPASIKPGKFSLMVLTTGKQPKLIEQPVKVTIE